MPQRRVGPFSGDDRDGPESFLIGRLVEMVRPRSVEKRCLVGRHEKKLSDDDVAEEFSLDTDRNGAVHETILATVEIFLGAVLDGPADFFPARHAVFPIFRMFPVEMMTERLASRRGQRRTVLPAKSTGNSRGGVKMPEHFRAERDIHHVRKRVVHGEDSFRGALVLLSGVTRSFPQFPPRRRENTGLSKALVCGNTQTFPPWVNTSKNGSFFHGRNVLPVRAGEFRSI
jgi:hypothetical protein